VIQARAELYMSYYRKAIDGISQSSTGYLDYKYYECGKYWLHMPTYPPGSVGFHYVQLYMNRDRWNKLPEVYKKIILDAADVYSWASIWEILCLERVSEYRLVHDHGVIDVGIATKTPNEYRRICNAAVAAGKEYAMKRGVSEEEWNKAVAIKEKYADPEICAQYTWWYKAAWAEADRRLEDATKRIEAGEDADKVWASLHPARFYDVPYEQMKAELLSIPRCVRNWPMELRLK